MVSALNLQAEDHKFKSHLGRENFGTISTPSCKAVTIVT